MIRRNNVAGKMLTFMMVMALSLAINPACFGEDSALSNAKNPTAQNKKTIVPKGEKDAVAVESGDTIVIDPSAPETKNAREQLSEAYAIVRPLLIHYRWYIVSITLMIMALYAILRHHRRKKAFRPIFSGLPNRKEQVAQTDIVVRRKTTTILKKQNLGDVIHNDNYLKIDCQDFCADSSVRRIYIKNTCIKDIYDLYSNDLRNPENPKEDGCMVLGRWVYDSETDEYYVSLEYVVLPGDDAVFKEYELNFGGKIKLRVNEKLRRLRRETDMQYDVTCWVHSHPGLGVFFSSSDNSVQLQLKHVTHPRFLTAIVVDILTPRMEMGIFTFKHGEDLTVNSRQDIDRLYSLEKMHQWALESDRSAFKYDDYYDVLSLAQKKDESCNGIQLSNSAVIDLCKIEDEQQLDRNSKECLIAFAHGYQRIHGIVAEYVVERITTKTEELDQEMIGCIVNGSHLSLPSIQKAIEENNEKYKFVLFYSTANESLVAMPLLKGELMMDEKYFSEELLENLKVWTRRRRS